ncbi:MAG: hypothetical protein GX749_01640, partial [Ruminococcaceae bacterium]|nr:hypothetical protein [Oscillospiraceae bacterium]
EARRVSISIKEVEPIDPVQEDTGYEQYQDSYQDTNDDVVAYQDPATESFDAQNVTVMQDDEEAPAVEADSVGAETIETAAEKEIDSVVEDKLEEAAQPEAVEAAIDELEQVAGVDIAAEEAEMAADEAKAIIGDTEAVAAETEVSTEEDTDKSQE